MNLKDKEIQNSKIEYKILGSGAPNCKMLLVRIIENNKLVAYLRSG